MITQIQELIDDLAKLENRFQVLTDSAFDDMVEAYFRYHNDLDSIES